MGRAQYGTTAWGMSESEALKNAIAESIEEYGHQEGYSGQIQDDTDGVKSKCLIQPKVAKRAKFELQKHSGTRKWITRYCIYDFHEHNHGAHLKQGDAVSCAKTLAMRHNKTFFIVVEKHLESGDSHIGSIRPGKSTMGKWRFWGEARC